MYHSSWLLQLCRHGTKGHDRRGHCVGPLELLRVGCVSACIAARCPHNALLCARDAVTAQRTVLLCGAGPLLLLLLLLLSVTLRLSLLPTQAWSLVPLVAVAL